MIKSDIVKKIVKKHELPIRQAAAIVQTALDEIVSGLVAGGPVELRRFGTFKTRKQKARTIIHPKTGKPIERPARIVVLFESSSTLKTLLNKPKRKKPTRGKN